MRMVRVMRYPIVTAPTTDWKGTRMTEPGKPDHAVRGIGARS